MDDDRINPAQRAQREIFTSAIKQMFDGLTQRDHVVFSTIWAILAQSKGLPVPLHHPDVRQLSRVQDVLPVLEHRGLLWLDMDMNVILQCPPFSGIRTPYPVKVFGWSHAYACTLLDVPLMLLLYGPNAWLEVRTACPVKSVTISFRLLLDEKQALQTHQPAVAQDWVVWLPDTLFEQRFHARGGAAMLADHEALADYLAPDFGPGVSYAFGEFTALAQHLLDCYAQCLITR